MYAKVANNTLFLKDGGSVKYNSLKLYGGSVKNNTLYLPRETTIGGMNMAKFDRNRVMFFGSWTGNSIAESATVNIGDSTGVTAATIAAATFGAAVNDLSGEYVFLYNGKAWELSGTEVDNLTTAYGVTLTGEPAKDDIIVVDYTAASGGWEALGKDNDDLSKDLNPDTESSKNVLGETTFTHSGYTPEVSVEPYYIDPSRKLYKRIVQNALEERYGEADLLGYFAEAHFASANPNTRKMTGYCYVRRAWFVPQSVGGDTSGFNIPINVNPVGPVTKMVISYDMATNEATITAIT